MRLPKILRFPLVGYLCNGWSYRLQIWHKPIQFHEGKLGNLCISDMRKMFGITVPGDYGNNDEALTGIHFYWDALHNYVEFGLMAILFDTLAKYTWRL